MAKRGRRSRHGRTDDVPLMAFRVSKDERARIVAAAAAEKMTPNDFARRLTLAGSPALPPPDPSTPEPAETSVNGSRELTLVRDEWAQLHLLDE